MLSNLMKNIRHSVQICILLLLSFAAVKAQDTRIIWQKSIGGIGYDRIDDIITGANGDAYVLSTVQVLDNHEIQVSKINSSGTFIWTQTMGGERDDTGKKLLLDDDGHLIVLGATNSQNILGATTQGSLDLLFIQMTTNGEVMHVHTFGGSGFEEPASVLQKPNGNYIITATTLSKDGLITNNAGQADVWLFEINALGTIFWSETHGGVDDEYAVNTKLLDDGTLITVANTSTYEGDYTANHGDIDIALYHTTPQGQLLWKDLYGGFAADYAADIEVLANGHFLVAGNTFSNDGSVMSNAGGSDALLLKVDPTGDLLWSKTYGSFGNERIAELEPKGSGYVLFGSSNSARMNEAVGNGNQDFWMYEINSDMEVIHEYLFGASGFDEGATFSLQSDGSVLMGGESNSDDGVIQVNMGKKDGWLLKVNSNLNGTVSGASVHPNPSRGTVYVNELDEGAELSLTNMQGAPISNVIASYGTSRILDLSNQPTGVYILQINYPDRREVHRIIHH